MAEGTPARRRGDWQVVVYYLLAFASGGAIGPFLSLYLREVGLTGNQIGIMRGLTAFIATFLTPLMGLLADRSQRHRLILALSTLTKGLIAPLILVSNAWLWLTATVSVRVIGASAHDAVLNRLTMERLRAQGRRNIGAVRFWGGLSFAATSLLAGILARERSVSVLFPLAGVLGVASVFFVGAFPARIGDGQPGRTPRRGRLKRSPLLLFLFVVIFLAALSSSGPMTFTSVFLAEELRAGKDLIGLLGSIGSLAPIPAYYAADWLVRRRGPVMTLVVGLGVRVLSFGCYALLLHPAWALPLAMLEGFVKAFYLVSTVVMLSELGAAEHAATDQMLAQLTLPGLAGMVAQPLSGRLFDTLGARPMFLLSAVVALLAVFLLLFPARRLREALERIV